MVVFFQKRAIYSQGREIRWFCGRSLCGVDVHERIVDVHVGNVNVHRQYVGIHVARVGIHVARVDIHGKCVDIHEQCVDIHEQYVDIHKQGVDVHEECVEVHGEGVDGSFLARRTAGTFCCPNLRQGRRRPQRKTTGQGPSSTLGSHMPLSGKHQRC